MLGGSMQADDFEMLPVQLIEKNPNVKDSAPLPEGSHLPQRSLMPRVNFKPLLGHDEPSKCIPSLQPPPSVGLHASY